MQVIIPVISVFGSPSYLISTVFGIGLHPVFLIIAEMICSAVAFFPAGVTCPLSDPEMITVISNDRKNNFAFI
jgi:hypothetical protein